MILDTRGDKFMKNNQSKKQNKKSKSKQNNFYSKPSANNHIYEIYTYKKHKKPKRLGKECFYFISDKLTCELFNRLCTEADTCISFIHKTENTTTHNSSKSPIPHHKDDISKVGITAIVLNDNRKCTNEHHFIQDIQAELRIATPSNGLALHKIPAAYCISCNLYFVFKSDFEEAQALGKILCPVIDKTQKHLDKIAKRKVGGESRIHQLGYNVRKGNECTDEQRQMILANIVENTDISKYEITSLISKCIAQHKSQDNYANSVKCWQHDLEFISNYNLGDMPEVIIEKLIIGKRM